MHMPLVSVIIPVYNGGEYVRRSSGSVLSQTLRNLELILVDDGSKSDTAQLCDDIAATDSRVHVIHKENGGISSARNVGIEHASGEFVAFVDQDDWVLPDMYDSLYEETRGIYDVVISDFNLVYPDKTVLYKTFDIHETHEETYRDMLRHGYGGNIWNMIIRRKVIDENGIRFPEHLRHGEDTYFSWRLFLSTDKVFKVGRAFYQYNLSNPDQVSNHLDERFNECCRANIDEFIDHLQVKGKYQRFESDIIRLILQTKTDLVFDSKNFSVFNSWHKEANWKILTCDCLGYKMKIQMLLVSLHMYRLASIVLRFYANNKKVTSAY